MHKQLLLAITLLLTALISCEAPIPVNEFRDYTAPKILRMFPNASYLSNNVTMPSNKPFFIQFDDRMDPAIGSFDSDSITLENISVIPPKKIKLTFDLVNYDSCLLASFDPNDINGSHIYRLIVGNEIKNYNRILLENNVSSPMSFMFQGIITNSPPTLTITSHTNYQRSSKIVRLSGNCTSIEEVTAFFLYYPETRYTATLNYGDTNWSIEVPIPSHFTEHQTNILQVIGRTETTFESDRDQVQLCFDITPPIYYMVFPFANCTLSNTMNLHGYALDDYGIKQVTMTIGTNTYEDTNVSGSYWEVEIDSTTISNDTYTYTVTIEDIPGNRVTESFNIIVNNVTN